MTPKQQRFVDEYLIDLNATQAAIRAGYSAKNADKIGPELLGKTRVAEAISVAQKARSEKTETTAAWVLEGLKKVYEASMERNDKGLSANLGAANRALELLGRHLGMFKDAALDVSLHVNLPTDQTPFREKLAAKLRQRALAEKTQLHSRRQKPWTTQNPSPTSATRNSFWACSKVRQTVRPMSMQATS